jgi:hypothetical protein
VSSLTGADQLSNIDDLVAPIEHQKCRKLISREEVMYAANCGAFNTNAFARATELSHFNKGNVIFSRPFASFFI